MAVDADDDTVRPPLKRARPSPTSSGDATRPGEIPNSRRLFAPFRALGLLTNHVPFALQLRAVKGSAEGPRLHILTCLGNSWALWEGEKMTLLFVGECALPCVRLAVLKDKSSLVGSEAPDSITGLAFEGDYIWAASGLHVLKYARGKEVSVSLGLQCPRCSSVRKVGRLANPLGTSITSPLVFGSHLLALTEDGRNLLTWDISEEGEGMSNVSVESVLMNVKYYIVRFNSSLVSPPSTCCIPPPT